MSDKTTQSGKRQKQPFDKTHPYHPDYTGDNPRGILLETMADDVHILPSTAEEQHEQDQQAEQQLKQQRHQQDERSAFQKGSPQGRR
jgi:hypothetical protein